MQTEINKNKSRNVTKKDIIRTIIVVVFLISALILGEIYSKTITVIMFGILSVVALVLHLRTPKEEKKALAEAVEKHGNTYLGRLMKIVHYAIGVAILAGIIAWILNNIK